MDLGIMGLIVSGLVASIQIFTFFDNRNIRKETSLNTFAKSENVKNELSEIRIAIDTKINHLTYLIEEMNKKFDNTDEEIGINLTDIAVIKERINNDKEIIKKLDEKLDRILDKI
jgi:peptidoglycan hydrolase CwlO-like protein